MVDANMQKIHRFACYNSNFFPGAIPELPCWEGATAPLPKPHPFVTPALRTSAASLGASNIPNVC